MTKSHAVVSASEVPTPKQMKEFWLQVESGRMTKERFQNMLRSRVEEVTSALPVVKSPFFANEEVESDYGYPPEYAVKSVYEQLVELSRYFNGLNTNDVLACFKELPALPAGAEGWFAVPRWEKVAKTYNEAVENVLDLIGKTRTFHNYRQGNLGPKYLRLSERTAVALQMLGQKQKGDFLLIPAQFGLTHCGRSVRRVRVVYAPNEFGLGSFIAGCMILSHPERLVAWEQLHIDCPGDEYSPVADGDFSHAPIFRFSGGKVGFDAYWFDVAHGYYGSASAFLSQ